MKVVYIAGPFRAGSAWEIELNVRRAEEAALQIWRMGMATLCPHTNTRFFQGAAADEVWLKGDLEMLSRCDAVLLVEGWERSEGAKAEAARARELGIPVFDNVRDLEGWYDEHCRIEGRKVLEGGPQTDGEFGFDFTLFSLEDSRTASEKDAEALLDVVCRWASKRGLDIGGGWQLVDSGERSAEGGTSENSERAEFGPPEPSQVGEED